MRKLALVAAIAVVLAAAGTTAGVLLSDGSGPSRGPMYWDKNGGLVGEAVLSPPGEVDAMTVYGVLKGQKAAYVSAVRALPLPGYPTPRVVRTAVITCLCEGYHHGWPTNDPDFKHRPLIGKPLPPSHDIRILVGLASKKPGFHVAAGVVVDYTVDGHHYRTRLYAAMQQCIEGPGARCGSDANETAESAVEKMARG